MVGDEKKKKDVDDVEKKKDVDDVEDDDLDDGNERRGNLKSGAL